MKPRTPSQELKTRYQQALDYRKKYTLENSEYVELEDVKGGIFELNTDQIISHVSGYLGS